MAQNEIKFRSFSTGGALSKTFRLWRRGSSIDIEDTSNGKKFTFEGKTVAEAKAVMETPAIVCK